MAIETLKFIRNQFLVKMIGHCFENQKATYTDFVNFDRNPLEFYSRVSTMDLTVIFLKSWSSLTTKTASAATITLDASQKSHC